MHIWCDVLNLLRQLQIYAQDFPLPKSHHAPCIPPTVQSLIGRDCKRILGTHSW